VGLPGGRARVLGHGSGPEGYRERRVEAAMAAAIPVDTPCGYCFEEWATVWDHILPRTAGGKTRRQNLMPACVACNAWFSNRVFDSIEAKREARRQHLRMLARDLARGTVDAERGGAL
jgi:hypothetical protein